MYIDDRSRSFSHLGVPNELLLPAKLKASFEIDTLVSIERLFDVNTRVFLWKRGRQIEFHNPKNQIV